MLGFEAAGTVDAVGPGVTGPSCGDGVAALLLGGGGSVGIIATQLAVAKGLKVISAVGEHDEALARRLGAVPVRYGSGLVDRVRALGPVDAVFDAAGAPASG